MEQLKLITITFNKKIYKITRISLHSKALKKMKTLKLQIHSKDYMTMVNKEKKKFKS